MTPEFYRGYLAAAVRGRPAWENPWSQESAPKEHEAWSRGHFTAIVDARFEQLSPMRREDCRLEDEVAR